MSNGIYMYDRETLPALLFRNADVKTETIFYKWSWVQLEQICAENDFDYEKLALIIRQRKAGVHTIMIDVPVFRALYPVRFYDGGLF